MFHLVIYKYIHTCNFILCLSPLVKGMGGVRSRWVVCGSEIKGGGALFLNYCASFILFILVNSTWCYVIVKRAV